ncbi:vomeronasal type-2 receptor 26 [Ornithorhynchus anatinus]|uniref:vomeronasal type-2 receptor 26 n=1 Tax=Ornithorhynchus anatinus TaxID=9258 RepID=UPI0010A8CC2C|nr:vomeronasal type-2 receptor 26 [Ornithorhynchus anatinus]
MRSSKTPLKESKCVIVYRSRTLERNYSSGYYQDRDVVIGGLLCLDLIPGHFTIFENFTEPPSISAIPTEYFTKHYQHLLALVFAVEEIYKDTSLLPNISLCFYLFDVHFLEMFSAESSMALFSGRAGKVPSYSCELERRDKLLAVIGGMTSGVTTTGSWLLGLYDLPQICYGPEEPTLRDKAHFPSLYQISVRSSELCSSMIHLMRHFHWVWIGFLVTDDFRGQMFTTILKEMTKDGICVTYVEKKSMNTLLKTCTGLSLTINKLLHHRRK